MLDFRLKQPLTFPFGRIPRLNRQHPLITSQKNILNAAVAQGKGMYDLATNTWIGNTTTLSGFDENGPYVWSNDNAGTATCSFQVSSAVHYGLTWGCIFKVVGVGGRSYPFGCTAGGNTGIFLLSSTIDFTYNGGVQVGFTAQAGHTYFAVAENIAAAASSQKYLTLVDLTTGQVYQNVSAATGNLTANPVSALVVYSTFTNNPRLYAMFVTGSTVVPPSANASAYYNLGQIFGGGADPWSLWYA